MIVLQILKVIGIVLLVILCLILFLIAVILFVPIFYKADGSYTDKENDMHLNARASWILHIIRFVFKLDGREQDYALKVLFFEVYPGKSFKSSLDDNTDDDPDDDTDDDSEDDEGLIGKIKYKITSLYDRIRQVIKKIRQILFVLNDERDQETVRELLFRVKVLLKHILPRKGLLRLHIGLGDPASTGQVTGIIYTLYPIYTTHLLLEPDFDEKVTDADLSLKGHIQLIFVVIAAVRIYFNKDIRRLYRQIQQIRE